MFNTLPPVRPVNNVTSLIWPDRAWTLYFRDHPDNANRGLVKAGGHPNEMGHRIISDLLIPEIDRVTMS